MLGEETVVPVFCQSNLSFRQNKPIRFETLTFSPTQRKLTHLFIYLFIYLFKTVLSVFCLSNLSFTQNQPMKFEILVFLPAQRNFTIFGSVESETTIQILLKLFAAVHCQDRKLMCLFFFLRKFIF